MEKKKAERIRIISLLAISGNILFMLWITLNGLKEHFRGTIYEKLSYAGLIGLLMVNSLLIFFYRKQK